MIEKELFYKIANKNFGVFEIVNENDVQRLYDLYPDKDNIRQYLSNKLFLSNNVSLTLPQKTSLEIYILLAEYCFRNNISLLETCALFKVISNVIELLKENITQQEMYDKFKSSVLKFSMNRFCYQIGIFQKRTVYLIINFFVDVIYRRFYFFLYALTKQVNIDLNTRELSTYELPKVDGLEGANEVLPRNVKILRQYFESKRPKTELEMKIEMVLEFERERLDKKMEQIFEEQDEEFNKKVDEILKKKK